MCFRRFFLVAFLAAVSSLAGATGRPDIILITLDTTRADRLGFLGSQLELTPNLDALAHDGVVFTHAYSNVPLTTASHATILTGTFPQFHRVNDAGVPLAKGVPYAPDILGKMGYRTAAFVGAVILDPDGGAPGFARGFQTYDAGFRARLPGEDRYKTLERRGSEVVEHAAAWLNKKPAGPFFLWVHLYDPHAPYDPPEPFRSRYRSNPYDGEIASTDSAVGKLLDKLRAKKLFDDSLIVVVADHGEALGEHGERGHGIFLYDPTIHVPLLMKMPRQRSAGRKVENRVSLVDVMPTLLQVAGGAVPKAVQGESLLPLIYSTPGKAKAESDRPAYAESDYPHNAYGWSPLRSLRSGNYLFIEAPRRELYYRSSDPSAEHDLFSNSKAVGETLQTQLHKFRERTSNTSLIPKQTLSAQQQANLQALGYVASGNEKASNNEVAGVDPKDKIEIANQMTEANLLLESERYPDAIQALESVVSKDSSVSAAYAALGAAWSALGNYREAVTVLRKAVELRPKSVNAHYQLGTALFETGDLQGAAPQYEAAVAGFPESADMHYSLAAVYVRIHREEDAKYHLLQALSLKPKHFDANLMLGQLFLVQKTPARSLPYLDRAVAIQPRAAQPHQLLAEAYAELGQKQKSEEERRLAAKLSAH
jgi:arylsulfatase A-like enzyme/Tfp pilus assembly protein PilF